MSRPIPNVTLGGYRPNQVKINSIGIGIDDDTLDSLNLDSSQYMVVGGQTNDVYNMIVDSEGVVINSSIINRAAYSNEYALFVDGNIYVTGKVDTSAGTLSNVAGGGSGSACNFWMPVRRDIPSSTNIFYDGRINIANESQSRSNTYRVNIVDSANYSISNAQLAIQNQVGSVARIGIIGYSNLSPVIVNSSRGAIEFHAARNQDYFSNVYYRNGQYQNLPLYASNTAPHMAIGTDGNVGIKVSPNPPLTYNLRTFNNAVPQEMVYTPVVARPVELHVNGAMFSSNMLMYDYESASIKNLDDLYVRRLGVTFAASQVEPGYFAPGDYTFRSNVSIGGPIEDAFSFSIYGKMHILDQLFADKAFLTSNLVAQDTLEVLGTSYFENDVIANENVQVNQNLVIWGGLYADSNAIYTIVPGGSNQNTTTTVSFVGYTADGWSNIYPVGAGFITPGKAGVGINSEYDTTPGQLTVVSRDSNIYAISLMDKTNPNFTKALFVGHQRSNVINGRDDASVIFATPSGTSPYFSFTGNRYAQNMYFYPGQYDKTVLGSNTAADNNPPTMSICETGQVAVNSFQPNSNAQLYVKGSIGFSSNLYVFDSPDVPIKLAQFRYVQTTGLIPGTGVSYNDTSAPYVGINKGADTRYGLAVSGGVQADAYYAPNDRKGVMWMDSTTANSDTTATASDGLYVIGKVGIGINQPDYILDIYDNNQNIGNTNGTYVRLIKSVLGESSNTGIMFDGIDRPWFTNVESISSEISRYSIGCSPDVYSLVDTSNSISAVLWSSNTSNSFAQSNSTISVASYIGTAITSSNLTSPASNIVNSSNIFNVYNITYLSNITSNITYNPSIPAFSYSILYDVSTSVTTGILETSTTTSNYATPLSPSVSNIINTSNLNNTSNVFNTSNVYYYLNTSNYVYSSNSTGIMIQHDNSRGIYGHQIVIGGNASLVNNSLNNPNPNPSATLTVNGDTSIIGGLNVTGYITANNIANVTTSARSNVPTIQADDLFISGKDVYVNPTNKMYVNYTCNILAASVESGNKAVFNVYQDIVAAPVPPIARFIGASDRASIEIVSEAINSLGGNNDGILRIGLLPIDPQNQSRQVIAFQDGSGDSYMTFSKLGSTQRGMGINTATPNAQLHIVNNTTSMNSTMARLTYDNGSGGDTENFAPNIMLEKTYTQGANAYKKEWIIQGPTHGTDLYDQLAFKFVSTVNTTITSNTVLSITSNGCIGINNTSPTYLLDIATSNLNDGRNHGIRLWNKVNTDIAQLVFQSGTSPDIGGDVYADYVMYSCNSEFLFNQRTSATTTNPLLYYNSNTNLGIKTTPNDSYGVNIGGTLNVKDSIYVNGYEIFNTSNVINSGFIINGTSNIYLKPDVSTGGGVVVNGNTSTGNLFHVLNDNTSSANLATFDSILDTASIYLRNKTSSTSYNVYQMHASNTTFGLSYQSMSDRSFAMPSTGLSNVLYIDGVQGTGYKEHDLTLNGNLTLSSSVRGLPSISFGSNGTISGTDQRGCMYIIPGRGSNIGIGTTLPRGVLDIVGNTIVSGNIGIGTTIARRRLDVASDAIVSGSIGIGTTAPRKHLDVIGTTIVSGNIGIGNTAPVAELDVVGTTIVSGNIGIGTTIATNMLSVYGNASMGTGLNGLDDSTAGGPFFLQNTWDSAGSTHTIAYPTFCVGDNSSGMIYIQVSNKSTTPGSAKMGNIQASFIKPANETIDISQIASHSNVNLSTLSLSNIVNDIIVTTDSDCYVSWTSIGSY